MPVSSTFHETKFLLSRDYPTASTTQTGNNNDVNDKSSLSTQEILKLNKQQRLQKLKEATNMIEEEYQKLLTEEFDTPEKEAFEKDRGVQTGAVSRNG